MPALAGALVAIVRDFCRADALLRQLMLRFRDGSLRFQELTGLVGDDDSSVLYRLKERSHASFRSRGDAGAVRREALFDLAVSSLFHEAMAFRENFYQREVYGPKVRALRHVGDGESDALFREFEKILATADARLRDGLSELEALLGRTRDHLLSMLRGRREDGALARYLIENRESVESMFGQTLPQLLAHLYGDLAGGYEVAGRSYLANGYFAEADRALAQASAAGSPSDLAPLRACARGLQAFLAGDYPGSLAELAGWWEERGVDSDPGLASLAVAAASRIAHQAELDGRRDLAKGARRLEQWIREALERSAADAKDCPD